MKQQARPISSTAICAEPMTDAATRTMYSPKAFVAADAGSIIDSHPFALLITSGQQTFATPTAVFFEREGDRSVLVGHLARRNQHALALEPNQPALVVFSGPHAYISASWYVDRQTVPTWNYVAAQVRGRLEPIDDASRQLAILRRTVTAMEQDQPDAWTIEQPDGRVEKLLPLIRAFRIEIESIEGVTKLNQTHPASDRRRVVQRLLDRHDSQSTEIARLMTHLPET